MQNFYFVRILHYGIIDKSKSGFCSKSRFPVCLFFGLFVFLGLNSRYMEVPGLGV